MTSPKAPLRLVLAPAEVLRHKSAPVRVFDSGLRHLVDEMYVRCEEWSGVGLAAPQVGVNVQVAVIVYEGRRFAICNPEIISAEGQVDAPEGCLSMPDHSGEVRRSDRITVRYRNVQGKGVQRDFEGWLSRIVQHESDHLVGTLCSERLAPGATFGPVTAEVEPDEATGGTAAKPRARSGRRAGKGEATQPAGPEL
ncbi:MAG TPA: peptide deformylase [Candidatus Dormibacteraeota bacterium]|nr:peptide deformylase [Candidatus Dormibacteraeota bacterium]